MSFISGISTDSVQFYAICALITVSAGLIAYIHRQAVSKIDRVDSNIAELSKKRDDYEAKNAEDHARVIESLTRVEEGIKSIDKDVQRHEKRIDRIERNIDTLNRREL